MTTNDTKSVEQSNRVTGVAGAGGLVPELERGHLRDGVGARLAWLRKRAGMSQDHAGKLAGISPGGLSKLERGVNRPTKDSLRDLAAVYAPDQPRREYWKLCTLAGESLRASHRRQSPARKPLTVAKAEYYLTDAQRAVRAAQRGGGQVPGRADRAQAIAAAYLAGAERDLEVARARESLIEQLRAAAQNGADGGQNVG